MINGNSKVQFQYKYYTILSMLYCTLLIVSVLLPYKIINILGFREPGGIFIFPLTYLLGGAIAETYGRKLAVRTTLSSIFCLLIFNILIAIIVRLPSADLAANQEIFLQAFGNSIRLSAGCILGLLASDMTNIYKITSLKLIFGGRYFIQRCLWSTAISEAIFNVVTYTVTYIGLMHVSNLIKLMVYSWVLKMVYSLMMIIPLLLFMRFLKHSEGADVYDIETTNNQFNPESMLLKFLNLTKTDCDDNHVPAER